MIRAQSESVLRLRAEYSRGLAGDIAQNFYVSLLDSSGVLLQSHSLDSHNWGTIELDYWGIEAGKDYKLVYTFSDKALDRKTHEFDEDTV